jgi:hypothetical protein
VVSNIRAVASLRRRSIPPRFYHDACPEIRAVWISYLTGADIARFCNAMANLTKLASAAVVACALLGGWASPAAAQYFGRNKVQYREFDFQVLKTAHFDIHYYPEEDAAARDVARMA